MRRSRCPSYQEVTSITGDRIIQMELHFGPNSRRIRVSKTEARSDEIGASITNIRRFWCCQNTGRAGPISGSQQAESDVGSQTFEELPWATIPGASAGGPRIGLVCSVKFWMWRVTSCPTVVFSIDWERNWPLLRTEHDVRSIHPCYYGDSKQIACVYPLAAG